MANRLKTYRAIAHILNLDTSQSELEALLRQPDFDWDAIVVEGSKHLVLPAMYCSLKRKQLLHCLPEELESYLQELTSINRNRNEAIKLQTLHIIELFTEHNINYVLLKGTALLMANVYEDIGERMIGDIDILVEQSQLTEAFRLLEQQDYVPIDTTFGEKYVEHKHLPRLKTDVFIAAVELHRKVFMDYEHKALSPHNLLSQKQLVDGAWLPNKHHVLLHNILNFQISDYGFQFKAIGFRTVYDHLLITARLTTKFSNSNLNNRNIASFLSYHNELFNQSLYANSRLSYFQKKYFNFRLEHTSFDRLRRRIIYTMNYLKLIGRRIGFFLTKKDYRKSLWADRKRIIFTLRRQIIHNKPPH
ncbi:nucleotidyltransferase family protein [Winogradskyella sp. DF17]|uniref:Nucleotidyltransferase family protein n=1 Tax=Winogradskyella pelagia TaxID=2819984 RepID=A0ABS3SZ48_9FLAO|nr:nucleotidyltransferase family protein [Winogradskyella sp. DF17]MBO3115761.1 nucleotidyltransferase family protein [Winogradskyella sp. DF17]